MAERPREFEHLNNGVTILAERIEPKNNNGARGKRLDLTGLSIINGAQTVASSAQFVADEPNSSIADAYVPVTVIQADVDNDFSKRVTRARNHQNPVYAQNFAALDDEQERLRRQLALLGLHYAYKPESLDDAADPNRIRIEEAAQALAVVNRDPRFPVYLKKEPGQLLLVEGATYKALFTPSLTRTPLSLFADAARMHDGGPVLRPDEVPAILQTGERVLSRREVAEDRRAAAPVTVNIYAQDARSFMASRTQISAELSRMVEAGRRGR